MKIVAVVLNTEPEEVETLKKILSAPDLKNLGGILFEVGELPTGPILTIKNLGRKVILYYGPVGNFNKTIEVTVTWDLNIWEIVGNYARVVKGKDIWIERTI